MPAAVIVAADGYRRVDYSLLGFCPHPKSLIIACGRGACPSGNGVARSISKPICLWPSGGGLRARQTMLDEHYDYHSTRNRNALFERAIAATVRPGDRVADLGCGTGVLGLMCLKAGAGFSYEIETGPILEAARETFMRAGFAERAAFIREKTNRVTLPEPVDLLICDHVGYFGIDYGIIAMLQDARRRFLAPGGRIMPRRLVLRLAPVSSRKTFRRVTRWRAPKIAPEFRWLNDLGNPSEADGQSRCGGPSSGRLACRGHRLPGRHPGEPCDDGRVQGREVGPAPWPCRLVRGGTCARHLDDQCARKPEAITRPQAFLSDRPAHRGFEGRDQSARVS